MGKAIVPVILNFDATWVWSVCELHAPAALPSGKYPLYPLDRLLDGFKSRSEDIWGVGGEKLLIPGDN